MASSGEVAVILIFSLSLIMFLAINLAADSDPEDSLMVDWSWIAPVGSLAGLVFALLTSGWISSIGIALFLFFIPLAVPALVPQIDLALFGAYLFPAGYLVGQQFLGNTTRNKGADMQGLVAPLVALLIASAVITIFVRREKNE